MLDLALLDLIIRDRARTASERKDVDHRHVTDIDALVHTVAQDRIGEVATVVATQMDVDIVDEIMEVTADVAAGRCHDLLHTLALNRLVRTMRRQGRRRGITVDKTLSRARTPRDSGRSERSKDIKKGYPGEMSHHN